MPQPVAKSALSLGCAQWNAVDNVVYGNVDLGSFVFELDLATGKASSVKLKTLRITLDRTAD